MLKKIITALTFVCGMHICANNQELIDTWANIYDQSEFIMKIVKANAPVSIVNQKKINLLFACDKFIEELQYVEIKDPEKTNLLKNVLAIRDLANDKS